MADPGFPEGGVNPILPKVEEEVMMEGLECSYKAVKYSSVTAHASPEVVLMVQTNKSWL